MPPQPEPPAVQGFMYSSNNDENDERNDTVCKVIGRAGSGDAELREYGPMFYVVFGDGHERTAYASELEPWFPI